MKMINFDIIACLCVACMFGWIGWCLRKNDTNESVFFFIIGAVFLLGGVYFGR